MIINNENKKLSRNRKKRIERKNKMNDDMKFLLNKIKSEKKKKNKNFDKIRQLEILLVILKYANDPNKLQSALKELNKIEVINKNLHQIKEILEDYTGDFELIGKMIIGPVEHKTNIRFENMDDFERYINAIDIDYDSNDVIFTGYVYKLKTPQFKVVKRSAYGRGTNYMQEIVEYQEQNCYIPTSGMCFIKCIN